MSKSYTPGLKVLNQTKIYKDRILPMKGEVHTDIGEEVLHDKIVASTQIPGNVHMINLSNELNIDPDQVESCMIFSIGDLVHKNQIIAQSKGLFGIFKSEVKSPVDGFVTNISNITGQVIISEKPKPVQIDSYIPGKVVDVYKKEGVRIQGQGSLIQGIIGVGGEKRGELVVLVDSIDEKVEEDQIDETLKNKIIVCGSYLDFKLYVKAQSVGVKGVICGGFDYNDLSKILGYPLGVAITGAENLTTLIITEGFGDIPIAKRTFNLLIDNINKNVCINGATQIRAGVLRPEIIIPNNKFVEKNNEIEDFDDDQLIISLDSFVRVIREPYFGMIGKIVSLPSELSVVESGTKVRVAEVEFLDKSKEIIPRANLEVILSN